MKESQNKDIDVNVVNNSTIDLDLKVKKGNINQRSNNPSSTVKQPRRYNPVNPEIHENEIASGTNNLEPLDNQFDNTTSNSDFANKNVDSFQNNDNNAFNNQNIDSFDKNEGLNKNKDIEDVNPRSNNTLDKKNSGKLPEKENTDNPNNTTAPIQDKLKPIDNNNLNQAPSSNLPVQQNANSHKKENFNNSQNNFAKDPTQRKLDRINNQKKQQEDPQNENKSINTPQEENKINSANENTPKTKGSAPQSSKETDGKSGGIADKINKANQLKNALSNAEETGVKEQVKQVAKEQAKQMIKKKVREKILAFIVNVILPALPYIALFLIIVFFLLLVIFAIFGYFDDEDNVYNTIKINYCDHVNLKWGEADNQNVTVDSDDYIRYKINTSNFKKITDENALIPLVIIYRTNLYASTDTIQDNTCYFDVEIPYTEESNEKIDSAIEKSENKVFSVSRTVLSEISIDEHFSYRVVESDKYRLFQDKWSYNKSWVDANIGAENISNNTSGLDERSYSPFAAWYLSVNNGFEPLALIFHFVTPGSATGNIYKVQKLKSSDSDTYYDSLCSDISLSETTLTREEFIDKVDSYNSSYSAYSTFKTNAGKIYDISKNNNFNPEMVVIRAEIEGYSPGGSTNNYWGIGCTNTGSAKNCSSYSSFDNGVLGYINTVKKINSESLFEMQKKYAYIGAYWYNTSDSNTENTGLGGCYYFPYIRKYMSEERASEVENACQSGKWCYKNGSGDCFPTTDEDQNAYTRWQIEKSLNMRASIFGITADECSEEEGPHEDVPASELGKAVAEYAVKTYDSWQYSQANRDQNGYVDCSSLIYRAYAHFNVTVYQGGANTEGIYKWCESNGRIITGDSLAEGDLIFYNTGSHYNSDHYKGIGHVEMYIGNNQKFGAHTHYKTHPQDDVSIKPYTGGGNLFCRPASA